MSGIRLEVDKAYNCRPKRGERKAKDGRLVQCHILLRPTIEEALQEARETAEAGARLAPGYSEVIDVRAYDAAAFKADPLNCRPFYRAASLN